MPGGLEQAHPAKGDAAAEKHRDGELPEVSEHPRPSRRQPQWMFRGRSVASAVTPKAAS